MIAIVFLLMLLAVTIFAAATGSQALPIGEILMLVGVFVLFFGSGCTLPRYSACLVF